MQLVGHRGAAGEAPENALAGFAHAESLGLTGIEFDVHLSAGDALSADGVLVVIHDDTVDRTTHASGPISCFTAEELSGLGVPSLAQVLEQFPGFRTYQIEIKHHEPALHESLCRQLAETVERCGVAGRVIVISFDARALEAMRQVAPDIARGFLGGYADMADLETTVALGGQWVCAKVHSAAAEVLQAARERGLKVSVWTCNSEEDLRAALDLGAEAVASDVPTFARTCLEGDVLT